MKTKVDLIHKEKNTECIEVVKSAIIESDKLEEYTIDKNTMLIDLPESIVSQKQRRLFKI